MTRSTFLATTAVTLCLASFLGGWIVRAGKETGQPAKQVAFSSTAGLPSGDKLDEGEYFDRLAAVLATNYVDEVKVDQKMATGAVRGMVASLIDPDSLFYDAEEFSVYQDMQAGTYQGIGVELRLDYDEKELDKFRNGKRDANSLLVLPEVFVSTVVPGGPADKAGIKPGDRISGVNGKWLVTSKDLLKLRSLQTAVTEGKATPDALAKFRTEIERKAKNNLLASKVRDHLTVGKTGSVVVVCVRDGKEIETTVAKSVSQVESVVPGQSLALRAFTGSAKKAASHLSSADLKLDLRDSGTGDVGEIPGLLALLVPSGDYGAVIDGKGKAKALTVSAGTQTPKQIEIMVDSSTIGANAVLAHALSLSPNVTVTGMLPPLPTWVESNRLPDGSGYTLAVGKFSVDQTKVAVKR